jgi:hypothetical protein
MSDVFMRATQMTPLRRAAAKAPPAKTRLSTGQNTRQILSSMASSMPTNPVGKTDGNAVHSHMVLDAFGGSRGSGTFGLAEIDDVVAVGTRRPQALAVRASVFLAGLSGVAIARLVLAACAVLAAAGIVTRRLIRG